MIRKFYDYEGLNTGGESFSIADYNKRCAEFLGYKKDTVDGRDVVRIPNKTWSVWSNRFQDYIEDDWYALYEPSFRSLEFHSDWNWIMEVVEAIEKKAWVNIKGCAVDISTIVNLNAPTKKEAVVQAIDRFLIWYNENK